MIEKIAGYWGQLADSLLFFTIGMVIGYGQSRAARELDNGVMFGRAISVGGLSMAAGMVVIWIPDLPLVGQIGIAAALGSLGTAGIERVLMRVLEMKSGVRQ